MTPLIESCQRIDVPYWFWSHTVKDQGQTAGPWKYVVCAISLDPFAGKLSNLVQWMPLESRYPYWCLDHMVKSQGQTAGLWKMSSAQYLKLYCFIVTKFGTVGVLRD